MCPDVDTDTQCGLRGEEWSKQTTVSSPAPSLREPEGPSRRGVQSRGGHPRVPTLGVPPCMEEPRRNLVTRLLYYSRVKPSQVQEGSEKEEFLNLSYRLHPCLSHSTMILTLRLGVEERYDLIKSRVPRFSSFSLSTSLTHPRRFTMSST